MGAKSPRRVLIPLSVAMTLSLPGDAALYAILPSHYVVAGISIAAVGLILGINRAIRIFLNTPAGVIFDRTRRRHLFLLAMAAGTLSTAIYALSSGFWLLLVGRLLWGVSWSIILVGSYTTILDVTTEANRAHWTGIFQAFYLMGSAAGFAAGGVLMDWIGYRATLWVCTGLTGLGLIIVWLGLPETTPEARSSRAVISLWRLFPGVFLFSLRNLRAQDKRTRAVNFINFAQHLVGNGVISSTLGLALRQRASDDVLALGSLTFGVASLTGLLLAIQSVSGIGVASIAGWLSDRISNRWILLAWGCGIVALGFSILVIPKVVIVVLLGVLLVAVGRGLLVPALTALAGDIAPVEQRGRSMGGFATMADIGGASGPIIAYVLIPQIGLVWIYIGCIILIILAAFLAWDGHRLACQQKAIG